MLNRLVSRQLISGLNRLALAVTFLAGVAVVNAQTPSKTPCTPLTPEAEQQLKQFQSEIKKAAKAGDDDRVDALSKQAAPLQSQAMCASMGGVK
jgi:hypothetical protein